MVLMCTICLTPIDVKNDKVFSTSCGHLFHDNCLQISLKTSAACAQCRKRAIQSHPVYFEVDDNYKEDGTSYNNMETLNNKINEMTKTLDQINLNTTSSGHNSEATFAPRLEMERCKEEAKKINIENKSLMEIIEKLTEEVNDRNDIINALQLCENAERQEMGNFSLAAQRSIGVVKGFIRGL